MWNSNLIIFGSFMLLHVYVKRPEALIGIGRYIKRLIIIIIIKRDALHSPIYKALTLGRIRLP